MTVWPSAPDSSMALRKAAAVSYDTPMPAKTMAKPPLVSERNFAFVRDLDREAIVRQPATRKHRQFLAAHETVQEVDRRYARLDEIAAARPVRPG